MVSRLVLLAKEQKVDYAVDIYPHYGSDVGAAWRSGMDCRAALIGPGVHASHGMERTHLDALRATWIWLHSIWNWPELTRFSETICSGSLWYQAPVPQGRGFCCACEKRCRPKVSLRLYFIEKELCSILCERRGLP